MEVTERKDSLAKGSLTATSLVTRDHSAAKAVTVTSLLMGKAEDTKAATKDITSGPSCLENVVHVYLFLQLLLLISKTN